MITKLHGVTVFVNDQEKALTFYRDTLGFDVTMDQSFGNGFRWLTVAPKGGQTNIILHKPFPGMENKVGLWTGMIFYTDNLDETYRELTAKGVNFPVEPKRQDWGGYEGQFADPDGNTFELVQTPNF